MQSSRRDHRTDSPRWSSYEMISDVYPMLKSTDFKYKDKSQDGGSHAEESQAEQNTKAELFPGFRSNTHDNWNRDKNDTNIRA